MRERGRVTGLARVRWKREMVIKGLERVSERVRESE